MNIWLSFKTIQSQRKVWKFGVFSIQMSFDGISFTSNSIKIWVVKYPPALRFHQSWNINIENHKIPAEANPKMLNHLITRFNYQTTGNLVLNIGLYIQLAKFASKLIQPKLFQENWVLSIIESWKSQKCINKPCQIALFRWKTAIERLRPSSHILFFVLIFNPSKSRVWIS